MKRGRGSSSNLSTEFFFAWGVGDRLGEEQMVYKYTFVPKYKLNVNQLYQSAWAVITKYSRVDGLNNGNVLSYSSRSWEVQD